LEEDLRQQRNIQLGEAVAEVRRRLREFATERGVSMDVEEPLPKVEVNAAAVELCLTNYISNAVKYSDPGKPQRWVRVEAELRAAPDDGGDGRADGRDGHGDGRGDGRGELVVRVRDNGLGIPDNARDKLFQRFFRAHTGIVKDV